MNERTCQHCGHQAMTHVLAGLRCELCASCPGLHAPAAAPRPPGYLWEIAEDRCRVCGRYIGDTLRFLYVGVCNDCAQTPKH